MELDSFLIQHCSATLAGLKMGTLLCLPHCLTYTDYPQIIERYNLRFNGKQLHFKILFCCPQRTLLYIYRPTMVERYLHTEEVRNFLQAYGYSTEQTLIAMLEHLGARFAAGNCFPHELGLFLGYPLTDVCGFIRHKGNHAKMCGEWKVYGDAEEALRLFRRFDCCRRTYSKQLAVGASLESLIVA